MELRDHIPYSRPRVGKCYTEDWVYKDAHFNLTDVWFSLLNLSDSLQFLLEVSKNSNYT